MISIITTTYNRAGTLGRALDSVLRQTFRDWEVIVVDDGSTDDTDAVLAAHQDHRIRVLRHPHNRGVSAARNTGFDAMRGDWFTILDSDDEMTPDALATFARLIARHGDTLDSISCNCIDSRTGALSGHGFDRHQWLDYDTLASRAGGEHWGVIRSRLLAGRRFNEQIAGQEAVLWWKIHRGAGIFYLHRGLRIYHTEGTDSINRDRSYDPARIARMNRSFRTLFTEEAAYVAYLRARNRRMYAGLLSDAAVWFRLAGDRAHAWSRVRQHLRYGSPVRSLALMALMLVGASSIRPMRRVRDIVRNRA